MKVIKALRMTIGLISRYFLTAVLLFSLAACSSSNSESPDPDIASTTTDDDPSSQEPSVSDEESTSGESETNNPPATNGDQSQPADTPITPPPAPGAEPSEESETPEAPAQPSEPDDAPIDDQPDQQPVPDNAPIDDEPEQQQEPDDSNETDAADNDPVDAGSEPDAENPPEGDEEQTSPSNTPLTPPAAPGAEPANENPEGPADPPIDDPAQQPDDNPEADPDLEETEGPTGLLEPQLTPGSDLDRLVQGLTRQTALTLLDLNRRITGGEPLTDQQEACLGAYEEGNGFALTAIDCGERRLAVGNNPLRVGIASFYDTPECLSALMNQSSEGCVLQQISLTVGGEFGSGEAGPPPLLFPGALLSYAIGDTSLHIDSDSEMLSGPFSCDIDLTTLDVTSEFSAVNCGDTVKIVADQIEKMQSL